MVTTPSAANTTAAVMRIPLTGSFSAILSPISTARNIGKHHAKSGTHDDRIELLKPRGEADCGDLRLINRFPR